MAGRPDILVTNNLFINGYEYVYIASDCMHMCSFVFFFFSEPTFIIRSLLQNSTYSHEISYRQPNSSQEQIYALVWPEANVIKNTKVEDEGNWGLPRFFMS